MPDIFLSYNREDQAVARRFADAFSADGLDVWWDVTLRSGEAYDEVTENALRTAKAVVVLWSQRSVASRWVRAEATLADRNKTLIPVMIEACERPIMFELTQTSDLTGWDGGREDGAWRRLLADVRRFTHAETTPPEPADSDRPPIARQARPRGKRGEVPSLAVLPFTNRSGQQEDEVFAFGMVEDIIDAMSQGVDVRVLASSATARFRTGPIPDLDAMASQLGVRYVLEGNVRRVGQDLRVTTQLVDASRGDVVWTQKFDRPLAQLAELQERLVFDVAAHLRTQAHRLEIERALKKPGDLTAWEAVMRTIAAYRRLTGPSLLMGLAEARKAVEIDPEYGLALALVAQAEATIYDQVVPDNVSELNRIRALAEQAMAADPDNPMVMSIAGGALATLGFAKEALAAGLRAVALNPNHELGFRTCGVASTLLDRCDEATTFFDKEELLAPDHPLLWTSLLWRACAHIRAERWHEAVAAYDHALKLTPDNAAPNLGRAICARRLGRSEEAATFATLALKYEPDTPLSTWEMRFGRAWIGSPTEPLFLDHLRALWHQASTAPSPSAADL